MAQQRFEVGRAVTPSGVVQNAVITARDGFITSVDWTDEVTGEFAGLWAVPGFVDTHCHGADGVSFGDPDPNANRHAIDFHRRHGTTSLFASTVTEPVAVLLERLAVLCPLVRAGELRGIHLEGPFLAEEKKGAHDAELLCDPEPGAVAALLEAGGEALKMITMAPERTHAAQAAKRFTKAGVKVAFGHSAATESQTREALDGGFDVATHLFNAMNPIHHREPGPVPVLLTDERCLVELICDGVHLQPVIAKMAIEAAGPKRVAMVTDAMSATGKGDGSYVLGELDVVVSRGVARLATEDGSAGNIAGSTLTMAGAFSYLVQQVGCSIEQAATMCATTPARWHGLGDVGELVPGKRADICMVDAEGNLRAVIKEGQGLVTQV